MATISEPFNPPISGNQSRKNARALLVAALLTIHALLLAWAATRHSPAYDEVAYLPSGISHWTLGRFELYQANPPLVRLIAALPVVWSNPHTNWSNFSSLPDRRSEFTVGEDFIAANGPAAFWYFTLARWACLPFSLLGGYICLRWARELYGDDAGLMALALWCFCPTVLASGQMITPDMGSAACGVLAGYTFWHWLQTPNWRTATWCGLALGLTQSTKATWLVLGALWPMLWVMWQARRWWLADLPLNIARQIAQFAWQALIALYIVNCVYAFDGTLTRLGDYTFISSALGARPETDGTTTPPPGNRFAGSWLGQLPVPLPRCYLQGFDVQKEVLERPGFSYLHGKFRQAGWWYYYYYALAVKVPLGVWLLTILALGCTVRGGRYSAGWANELVLLAPVILVLAASSQNGINRHFRYLLVIFPFLYIWLSKLARSWSYRDYALAGVTGLAVLWSVVSSLIVYPHSLSYFNEVVGGPQYGDRHLIDSNIDWGQDYLYLLRWLDEHPEAADLKLSLFGGFNPRSAGRYFELVPKGPTEPVDAKRRFGPATGPLPGWYAISVTLLRGVDSVRPDPDDRDGVIDRLSYEYLNAFEPVARIGYSIRVYHITLDEANRVRRELGLEEVADPKKGIADSRE